MKTKHYTIYSLVTTLVQEAALVAAVLWLLPSFGINIPFWGLSLMVVALGTYAYITYRFAKKALRKKPIISPHIGSRGRTTTPISPKGYIRVRGELWQASSSTPIGVGEEVVVLDIDEMTLIVSPTGNNNHKSEATTLSD